MKIKVAKIFVQRAFCNNSASGIREALLSIENITNVHLYPKDSLIVFNFIRANEISNALNVLTAMGYPEEGEIV